MLKVRFIKSIYKSPSYSISKAAVVKTNLKEIQYFHHITVVGEKLPQGSSKETYELVGEIERNKKYGLQFRAVSCSSDIPQNLSSIEQFLVKKVKGVGKATAKKILKAYGKDTIKILDTNPEILLSLLGENKGRTIVKYYQRERGNNSQISELMMMGLGCVMAEKAVKWLKTDVVERVKKNPYILTQIQGIGFKAADKVGEYLNITKYSILRVEAGILHVILSNEMMGNCGIALERLVKEVKWLLGIQRDIIINTAYDMVKKQKLKTLRLQDDFIIYRPVLYQVESNVAERIACLAVMSPTLPKISNESVRKVEKEIGISLCEEQILAVLRAFENRISVITGGPGVGKTSVLQCICRLYKKKKKIALLSPTGKAARRLEESSKMEASTIHKALNITPNHHDSAKKLEVGLVIVDETSMMDVYLLDVLLQNIKEGAHIVFVGDVDQLPSVGCGAVLHDMIASGKVVTTKLTQIFRQAEGSNIIENAKRINNGDSNLVYGKDFDFHPESGNGQKDAETLATLYLSEIDRHTAEEVVLLCPQKMGELGVYNMNTILQEKINPKGVGMKGGRYLYKQGDRVMQLVNHDWAANGEVGVVKQYENNDGEESIFVEFQGGGSHIYTEEDIAELSLAYAMTIHKSQGSEYKSVLVAMPSEVNYIMLKRNLLYTAITRGKERVTMFGSSKSITRAIKTIDHEKRVTLLKEKIQVFYKEKSKSSDR